MVTNSMETPQIIEREFMGSAVRQNHKTRMFLANDLFNIYLRKCPLSKKAIIEYTQSKPAVELVDRLIQSDRVAANHALVATKGRNGGTWMHPFVFLDFAMWLDVDFKVYALEWMYDNLCYLRDSAGDEFKALMSAIKEEIEPEKHWIYTNEIRLIQGLAGIDVGERNSASSDVLHRLDVLQRADVKLIRSGVHDYHERKKKLIDLANLL